MEKFDLPIDIINESKGDNTYWAYYLNLLEYDFNDLIIVDQEFRSAFGTLSTDFRFSFVNDSGSKRTVTIPVINEIIAIAPNSS